MACKRQSPNPRGLQAADAADHATEGELHDAARALGWVVPQDEADAHLAETRQEFLPGNLPDSLRDPLAALARARAAASPEPSALETDVVAEANLARAARDGAPIPPEIEARMHADRDEAEARAQAERSQDAQPPTGHDGP